MDVELWCPEKIKYNPRFFLTVVSQDVNCLDQFGIWQEESHVLVTTVDSWTEMDCLGSNISYFQGPALLRRRRRRRRLERGAAGRRRGWVGASKSLTKGN